jgi:VanZ family protein
MILVFLFYKWKNEYKFFKIFISIGVFVIIAGIDEFHQLIIPGRVFNPNDLFFNILGLIAGTVFTTLFLRAKNNIPSADLQ